MGLISFVLDYEDRDSIETRHFSLPSIMQVVALMYFNNGAYAIPALLKTCQQMRFAKSLRLIFWLASSYPTCCKVMREQKEGRIIQNSSV